MKRLTNAMAQLTREATRRRLVVQAKAWMMAHPNAVETLRAERAWILGGASGQYYGDNGAALHQYLRRRHPDIPVYWVIRRDSPDLDKASAVGPVLFSDDVMTYVRVFLARVLIISHGVHDVPGCVYYSSTNAIRVRLGHGLTALKKTKPRLGHSNRTANDVFDLVPVCSEFERDNKLQWGIAPERLAITGMARFDTLLATQRAYPTDPRRLLYMPTWREEVVGASAWTKTAFYRGIMGLLGNEKLHALLNEHQASLDVFLHMNLQPHVDQLEEHFARSPVRLVALTDPQRAFAEASLLITDYSSVAWDMLYLDKPVVFYQFDLADHCNGRGGYVKFDESLPGPSLQTPDAVVETLEQHFNGTFMDDANLERVRYWQQRVFAYRDEGNRERITAAILTLLKQREQGAATAADSQQDAAGQAGTAAMPRRLLFVVTGLGWGGAESQVIDLARGFAARGWGVAVVSLLGEAVRRADLESAGIPVHSLGMKRGLPDPRSAVRLARIIRDFRPGVVHAHMVHANILSRLTRLLAPVPILVTSAHNVNEGASWRMWAYRLTDRLTNLTTNVSPAAVARSIERGAAPAERIRWMPNGIDMSRFKSNPEVRARLREALGVEASFAWLCVASLEPQKDYPNLLHALAGLKNHPARPQVLAVGQGSLQDELAHLAESVAPGMVRFLGLRSDVPALMAAADGCVLPSAWEGLPIVLLEASASCLPIVCTDVGGNRELVNDGVTGYVVPPAQPHALGRAMAAVMDMPKQEREVFGRRGRERVGETFSLNAIMERWERLYAELFAGTHGPIHSIVSE